MTVRISSLLILGVLFLNLACKTSSEEEDLPPVVKFQIGDSVTDRSIALVVEHASGTDTLRAEALSANIDRLNNLFPDIMADPEQATAIRREIVRQFVLERAMLADAESRGIAANPELVTQRIDLHRGQYPSEEAFEADLSERSMSLAELEEQVTSEIIRDQLLTTVGNEIEEPDSTEVEEFRQKLAIRIKAQHILFLVNENEDAGKVRKVAKTVLDSARAGVSFSDLARRHSQDPGSASLGGELPHFRTGEMVAPFEEAAFALTEPGEITDKLVRTAYGYHIIRLVERSQEELVGLGSAADLLHEQLVRKARSDYMDRVLESAVVHLNPDLIPVETVE